MFLLGRKPSPCKYSSLNLKHLDCEGSCRAQLDDGRKMVFTKSSLSVNALKVFRKCVSPHTQQLVSCTVFLIWISADARGRTIHLRSCILSQKHCESLRKKQEQKVWCQCGEVISLTDVRSFLFLPIQNIYREQIITAELPWKMSKINHLLHLRRGFLMFI